MNPEITAKIAFLKTLTLDEQKKAVGAMTYDEREELNEALRNEWINSVERKNMIALDNIIHGRPWSME